MRCCTNEGNFTGDKMFSSNGVTMMTNEGVLEIGRDYYATFVLTRFESLSEIADENVLRKLREQNVDKGFLYELYLSGQRYGWTLCDYDGREYVYLFMSLGFD